MNVPLDERLNRLRRWFMMCNDRPLLGFYHGSHYPLHRYPGCRKHPAGRVCASRGRCCFRLSRDSDGLYKLYEEIGGDLVWSSAPFFGLPWVEAALGCSVLADHNLRPTRSEAPAWFAEKPTVPDFSVENPWVQKLLEFLPALEKQSAGRYPVGVTLMRGISDLLRPSMAARHS